jgi:hypothetical protein
MTNTAIVSIYGQLVALTLELDKAITEKLDSRGFLLNHVCTLHTY